MKTKILLPVVLLIGITCLIVYGGRSPQRLQRSLGNQKLKELESRVRDIEQALMSYRELPSSLIDPNTNEAMLYKATYKKIQNEARARLWTNAVIETVNTAGIKFKESKPKKTITNILWMRIEQE
jgi:C4-dicarboxylate-specific signal transduction histidine kinase